MTALICGSIAYDTIMVFPDRFKNHILPDQVHILNVAFLVPQMRREFGGCAGNIAYNLHLLGGLSYPMATVGKDFGPYDAWMERCGVSREFVRRCDETYTAQAFITTDLDDNQITAFHPGAMSLSHLNKVPDDRAIRIGVVAPDGKEGMIQHAQEFAEAEIPFIFDPGQGLPMFDRRELLNFLDQATWVTVNDYEAQLLQQRTELSLKDLRERVEAVIVTQGARGSQIHAGNTLYEIPVACTEKILDPTGCGDAFRAGLIYGLLDGMDWPTTGRLASLLGAIKIEAYGTQNHCVELPRLRERFEREFGYGL